MCEYGHLRCTYVCMYNYIHVVRSWALQNNFTISVAIFRVFADESFKNHFPSCCLNFSKKKNPTSKLLNIIKQAVESAQMVSVLLTTIVVELWVVASPEPRTWRPPSKRPVTHYISRMSGLANSTWFFYSTASIIMVQRPTKWRRWLLLFWLLWRIKAAAASSVLSNMRDVLVVAPA